MRGRATTTGSARAVARCVAILVAGLGPLAWVPVAGAQEAEPCPLPDRLVEVTDTPWAQTWLRYEQLWRFARGEGVLVAVIDTGVDAGHPQLAGRVLPGTDVVDPLADWGVTTASTATGPPGDLDCHGHGTFVAGIIAAAPSATNPFVGVAPESLILPIRQAHSDDDGTAGSMARAIIVAVDAGASVINISSSVDRHARVLEDAVAYAVQHDIVIVASVSNNGASPDQATSYPAALPGVLSVGSIDASGSRSSTSETGPGLDLMAPGQQVTSTVANSTGLGVENGTSYATPFVAGTAALVRSRFPRLTAEQVIHRLLVTSDYTGHNRPDDEYGWGILNPERALTAHLPEEEPGSRPEPTAVALPVRPEDRDHSVEALAAIGGVSAIVCLASLGAGVVGAGRQRRWRPLEAPPARRIRTGEVR